MIGDLCECRRISFHQLVRQETVLAYRFGSSMNPEASSGLALDCGR